MRALASSLMACVACAGLFGSPASAGVQCAFEWDDSFGVGGSTFPTNMDAACMYDAGDGNGPRLYVGGLFRGANGVTSFSVASFDGDRWHGVGGAVIMSGANRIPARVYDMTVWDPDGAGAAKPVLVVCGDFTFVTQPDGTMVTAYGVATWDGESWASLGQLFHGDWLNYGFDVVATSLAVYDSGSGPTLYIAGDFETADFVYDVAKWNGSAWVGVGFGLNQNSWIENVIVHNDGSGSALYIAGSFGTTLGTANTKSIAKWNGSAWLSVGGGRPASEVETALASFDPDGPGGPEPKRLYAAGLNGVEKWDGTTWTGIPPTPGCDGYILTMEVMNNTLYAAGGRACNGDDHGGAQVLFRFNGTLFEPIGDPVYGGIADSSYTGSITIEGLHAFDLGTGPQLFVGGYFRGTATIPSPSMLFWNGSAYTGVLPAANTQPGGLTANPDSFISTTELPTVSALERFDPDGPGSQPASLYVGGSFTLAGSTPVHGVARLDAGGWHDVFGGIVDPVPGLNDMHLQGSVFDFAQMNIAGTPTLFASGTTRRQTPGQPTGIYTNHHSVYRLTSSGWVPLGGHGIFSWGGFIKLAVADVGSGPFLYAIGRYNEVAGQPRSMVARWDGSSWQDVGGGLKWSDSAFIDSAIGFNDGNGPALFVAGDFTSAANDTVPIARGVAKWNGTSWSDASNGLSTLFTTVDMFVRQNELWAFAMRSSTTAEAYFYRWNGPTSSWTLMATVESSGAGIYNFTPGGASDHGEGVKYYFTRRLRGLPVFNSNGVEIIEFNPANLAQTIIAERSSTVTSVARYDYQGQASLFFGGLSGVSPPGNPASSVVCGLIGRWHCPLALCPADFNGDGGRDVADLFAYINAWLAKTPTADINNSGNVDVADLFAYINAWLAGC